MLCFSGALRLAFARPSIRLGPGPGLSSPTALLALMLLSACSSAPVQGPTLVTPPAQFKEGAQGSRAQLAAAPAEDITEHWWTLFNDPALDALQARLVVGNENLKAALAQTAAARAVLDSRGAERLPLIGIGLGAGRQRDAASSGNAARGARNTHSLAASASWELDLWGRLSRAVDSAQATHQASLNDLAAVRLSAQATLTQTYFALRAAEARQALIERNIVGFQRSLGLTQARYDSGVVAQTDVLQAQTQLKLAQAQAIDANAERAQLEHAVAVLLGQPPSGLTVARTALLPQPPAVPPLLPATLLARRPDIAAAEQRLIAAYADIGVVKAAFLPSLNLSATAGYRGSAIEQLVRGPNLFWSVGASLAQTVFDGGTRRAATDLAVANADGAAADYRQRVLIALQEVEDNLVLADQLQAQARLQQEALVYAQRNLEITQDQYRVGTVSYLNVVTAQTSALESERSLLEVRIRSLGAVNQLLKNIAGRW